MGKKKTLFNLGGTWILEMYQGRRNSELQGTKQKAGKKQKAVTEFCYRNNAEVLTLHAHTWTK